MVRLLLLLAGGVVVSLATGHRDVAAYLSASLMLVLVMHEPEGDDEPEEPEEE